MCLINKFLALLIPLTRYVLSSNSYYIWWRKERKNCFHFLQQNWMGSSLLPASYAQIEDSLGRKFTKSSGEEEATGAGRWRVRALEGGWLASCKACTSTLDSSLQARARIEVVPLLPRLSFLLRQGVLACCQLLHPSPWGC